MMLMRKMTASPTLSQKSSLSPQLGWRVDGSPYLDLCPPTPLWGTLPSLDTLTQSPISDNAAEAQIAWTAYQGCSRRMNSACVANRSQSLEEQRMWWEETSSACRNAILLHNATLNKQYNAETAKNLELLENAYHIVQTMLDGLSHRREFPTEVISTPSVSFSDSSSTSITIYGDEPEPVKRPKRLGFSGMFGRMRSHLTARSPAVDGEKMTSAESILY